MYFDERGLKTEFTIVELDCLGRQKQRKLVRLLVWVLGIRKVLSDDIYPDSYDEQWPQTNGGQCATLDTGRAAADVGNT